MQLNDRTTAAVVVAVVVIFINHPSPFIFHQSPSVCLQITEVQKLEDPGFYKLQHFNIKIQGSKISVLLSVLWCIDKYLHVSSFGSPGFLRKQPQAILISYSTPNFLIHWLLLLARPVL